MLTIMNDKSYWTSTQWFSFLFVFLDRVRFFYAILVFGFEV